MQMYELVVVLPGNLTEDEATTKFTELGTALTQHGAESLTSNTLGKHRLAYEVKSARFGWFAQLMFTMETTHAREVQLLLERHTGLLRFALLRAKEGQKHEFSFLTPQSHGHYEKERTAPHFSHSQKVEVAGPVNIEELDKKLEDIIAGGSLPEKI